MSDRPFSKRNLQLSVMYKAKLRQELLNKFDIAALNTIERVMGFQVDNLIHADTPYPQAFEKLTTLVQASLDKQTPFEGQSKTQDDYTALPNVDPSELIERKRREILKQQKYLEYETAVKKRMESKRIMKSEMPSSSTFNLEEKWKEERKEKQKYEKDCYSYNYQHASPLKNREEENISESPLKQSKSVFQSVGAILTNTTSDDVLRTKQINELSRKYYTKKSEELPSLDYQRSKIETYRSHFKFM